MTLLNNATEAIQIGLEDFKSTDPRRASSALRNIFAGTLLLFKEKLSRLSPDDNSILIQQTIIPSLDDAGVLFFKGKGHKTVDVAQIKERFKNLGINTVKWNIFDEVNNLRNNVEHFYTEHEPTVVNEIVSKLFKIIRDFCVEQLHEEPAELFGVETWNIFLETDEIYESEKDVSNKSLAEVDWKFDTLREAIFHIRCTFCHSDLIHVQSDKEYKPGKALTLLCKKCLSEFDIEEVLEDCIIEELAAECHIAAMDGGEDPYAECPECSKETYIYEEMCCVNCGYQQPDIRCAVCHTPLDLEESYEGHLCSYHRYSMEKNQ